MNHTRNTKNAPKPPVKVDMKKTFPCWGILIVFLINISVLYYLLRAFMMSQQVADGLYQQTTTSNSENKEPDKIVHSDRGSGSECAQFCNDFNRHKLLEALMMGPLMQEDPRLIKIVRTDFLRLSNPRSSVRFNKLNHQKTLWGHLELINDTMPLLKEKVNGFFVDTTSQNIINDSGLPSSLSLSTLYLEKEMNWTGVVFKPDAFLYHNTARLYDKSWIVPASVSPTKYAFKFRIPSKTSFAKQKYNVNGNVTTGYVKAQVVQAIPLFTVLAALNVTKVDFLSVGPNGKELEILKTIPFNKMEIKVIAIAHMEEGPIFMNIKEFLETESKFIFVKSYSSRSKQWSKNIETSLYGHQTIFIGDD